MDGGGDDDDQKMRRKEKHAKCDYGVYQCLYKGRRQKNQLQIIKLKKDFQD